MIQLEVEILARNLLKYCDLLNVKKKVLDLHQSEEQVRSVSNSMTVQVINQHHSPPAGLQSLSRIVEDAEIGNPVSLQEIGVLPQDQRKRYDYLEHVKQGLSMPIILLTYSHGNN